jgi:hypothetical protein
MNKSGTMLLNKIVFHSITGKLDVVCHSHIRFIGEEPIKPAKARRKRARRSAFFVPDYYHSIAPLQTGISGIEYRK